jgi:hypothetical protein
MKTRRVKRTKRKGGNWLFPKKCGDLNYDKSLADNIRNCKKNKDKWENLPPGTRKGKQLNESSYIYAGRIKCDDGSPEYINYPSNPECINDIIHYKEQRFK